MADSRKKTILASLVVPVFFSGIFAGFSPCKEEQPPAATLEFWGVFDDSDVWQPIIRQFSQQYPYITINYHKKNITTYESELVDALAAGRGPDIFMLNNSWLPKHKDKLAAAPETLISASKFNEIFVDVASADFIDGGKIYGWPLAVDTLALFYNKDLFNNAGVAQPPETWGEFNEAVTKLTRKDESGNIKQAGAAIGTARNVNRSTDILSALMLQSGAKMVADDKKSAAFNLSVTLSSGESFNPGEQALSYYSSFANPQKKVYTWNDLQHYSLDSFVEGQAAMMFNYAYQISVLRVRSPHLNFGVAPLPQISDTGKKITLANYWGQVVAKTSVNQTHAWTFLAWLIQPENLKTYLAATGKPTSRRDLVSWQQNDQDLGIFATQALTGKSWWQADNNQVEKILADAVDSAVSGSQTVREAIDEAVKKVTLLMKD
ncbi:MAG: extracellular solute-binding protein [Candidatus Portnoybacteria bacterium]|nr:extracellular solute-binding protein [Candidatus Portnoybacteria bacterium]